MKVKQILIFNATLLLLSACATKPSDNTVNVIDIPRHPTDEWVEKELALLEDAPKTAPGSFYVSYEKEVENYIAYTYLSDLKKYREEDRERAIIKKPNVSRNVSLEWGNDERGGAVMRHPAYIHVLDGYGKNSNFDSMTGEMIQHDKEDNKNNFLSSDPKNMKSNNDKLNNIVSTEPYDEAGGFTAKSSYSYYERQRWGRYCDNGKQMNESDWNFIEQQKNSEGKVMVPTDLLESCNAANYDLDLYMSSWISFCEGKPINENQRSIVKKTTRPKTKVNPCNALK